MPRQIVPLAALGALLLGTIAFGLAQWSEAQKLRASLAGLDQERGELRKKIWELQKLNGELAARRERVTNGNGDREPSFSDDGQPEATSPASRPQPGRDRIATFMNSPEMQQMMALQQKAGLDNGYAALFKLLRLSPADLEKFKNLLVEKQSAVMDVMAAARSQGLTGRESQDEVRKLVQDTQAEIDATIRTTLGEAAYAQYKNYETTVPQRNVVSQLEQRLSYSTAPLSDTQTEQLVQILAANTPTANRDTDRTVGAGAFVQAITGNVRLALPAASLGGASTRISDTAIAQAQGVLSPPQVSALQSLQQEQQAAAQLIQKMRTRQAAPTQSAPTGNPAPPPPGRG